MRGGEGRSPRALVRGVGDVQFAGKPEPVEKTVQPWPGGRGSPLERAFSQIVSSGNSQAPSRAAATSSSSRRRKV
jgi:hypothetical protein